MSFKDSLRQDNERVFLNLNEFAEKRTVRYDGEEYEDITVLLLKEKDASRTNYTYENKIPDVFRTTVTFYTELKNMDGNVPEQGRRIKISNGEALWRTFFEDYLILTSSCTEGMIRLTLRLYDE